MEWNTCGDIVIGHATGVRYVVSWDVLGWYFSWEFDPSSLGAPGTVTCRFDTLELARLFAVDPPCDACQTTETAADAREGSATPLVETGSDRVG